MACTINRIEIALADAGLGQGSAITNEQHQQMLATAADQLKVLYQAVGIDAEIVWQGEDGTIAVNDSVETRATNLQAEATISATKEVITSPDLPDLSVPEGFKSECQ